MQAHPDVQTYLSQLPEERKEIMQQLAELARARLPEGFEERMQYGMPSWVVPHRLYPPGYHTTPELPLPFLHLASQKRHIGLYHMGIYADPELLAWFQAGWSQHSKLKLNMGKSCIRFRKPAHVPLPLIGALLERMSPQDWIQRYEDSRGG